MEVTVRRLEAGDAKEILRFAEAFDHPIDLVATERFLSDARHHLFVGYLEGEPAGFLSAVELFHPDRSRPELFLNEIAVVERCRRRGVARALIGYLLALVEELGCRGFYVLTEPDNEPAKALYASTGGQLQEPQSVMFWYEPPSGPRAR